MKFYLNLLALGDNLISLGLLKNIKTKINIIGTPNTREIIRCLGLQEKINLEIVFEDTPAFYKIRSKGIICAIKDFYRLIKYIREHQINEIVYEKKDFRSKLISLFTNAKEHSPNQTLNAYKDRKDLIENVYSTKIRLDNYVMKINKPKKIVINPATGHASRDIKKEHLISILEFIKAHGCNISLLDLSKEYEDLKNYVEYYTSKISFEDTKKLIKDSDLCIGGDSFFIHFAYYFRRNYFIVYYNDWDYFRPPNCNINFHINAHKVKNFKKYLEKN